MDEFDYIIVGAGSAGCVLADRLSADGQNRVLVLEAGGTDRRLWIKVPIGYGRTFFDERVNWKYETEPDEGTNGRRSYWPRGKALGGSSSINAMVYFRGLAHDYEDWRQAGATGWGWDDVRPVFEKLERRIAVDGSTRGDGPVMISDVADQAHRTNRYFFDASKEVGLPKTEDFNGISPEGVGYYQITTRGGVRCSAADAFLRPAMKRRNVTLVSNALVERVTFDGKRATGVRYKMGGRSVSATVRKEVILSAGAVNSPQLLQLSGIGPGALLQEMGIEPIHVNEAVGGNLQDHISISYFYKATEPTLNNELAPWWGKVRAGMQYVLTRKGPLSLSVNQCGGFVKSSSTVAHPDMQLYFNPVTYTTAPVGKRPIINPDPFAGFIISFQPSRPTSRGRIDIKSPNPRIAARIQPHYLTSNKDLDDVVAGGRMVRSLVATNGLRNLIKEAIPPDLGSMSDDDILSDFRQRCGTVFHPVSTCAMGSDPENSVVDSDLKVRGVDGLRVVDASVFPNITSGNTNAPTIMVAYKAATQILQEG
ncbi:GMC family oxidoreductase [Aestuariispira ectoiniformans]|uniref:GMC family oxidoreductase n=1 Tax=Aestuariispira ectoiniformans TaxID=2775080 RepID=UPI00223A7E2B|nr:GMC family oxidoreductase N-terminal domain-containing protein [Aestuariispira ectoiniformans]